MAMLIRAQHAAHRLLGRSWLAAWVLIGGLALSGCASQKVSATRNSNPSTLNADTIYFPDAAKSSSAKSSKSVQASPASAMKTSRPALKPLNGDVNDLVLRAFALVNSGYRYGGNSPEEGFDCSGFIQFLYQEQLGVDLPRSTREIRYEGEEIDRKELQAGDLVFFNTMRRPFSHVGVYIGEGRFIHAPRSGAKVRIEDMKTSYWHKRFNGGRRVVEPDSTFQSASLR